MGYSVSNPPSATSQRVAGGPVMWIYSSADPKATVVGAGYITNAGPGTNSPHPLGMRVGDLVYVFDSNVPTGSLMWVSAINATTGAASLSYVAVA